MKTLIFRNAGNTTRVEVQADIFATNTELNTSGFNTRFTAMEIEDTDAAIALGINVNEKEYDWQDMIALANSLSGIGLYVTDLQEGTIEIVAP